MLKKISDKKIKKKYLFMAILAGIGCYFSACIFCLGNTFSMSSAEYAEQAQQIVNCSLCSTSVNE